jgi:hypothetical protein
MAPPLTGQQLMRRQARKVQRQIDDLAANVPGFSVEAVCSSYDYFS